MRLSDCVIYTGKEDGDGYCRAWDSKTGKLRYVHRRVWEEARGVELTRYDVIHHECRQKNCINLDHLRLMTRWDHRREHGGEGPKCPHGMAPKCLACRRAANRDAQMRWKNKQWKAHGCRQCLAPAVMGRRACAKHLEQEAHTKMLRRKARRDAM